MSNFPSTPPTAPVDANRSFTLFGMYICISILILGLFVYARSNTIAREFDKDFEVGVLNSEILFDSHPTLCSLTHPELSMQHLSIPDEVKMADPTSVFAAETFWNGLSGLNRSICEIDNTLWHGSVKLIFDIAPTVCIFVILCSIFWSTPLFLLDRENPWRYAVLVLKIVVGFLSVSIVGMFVLSMLFSPTAFVPGGTGSVLAVVCLVSALASALTQANTRPLAFKFVFGGSSLAVILPLVIGTFTS